jgi:uncharacterized membrane protein (DUF4010 family)
MKKWAIIGGIIAVVLLAVVIGFLYWGGEGPVTVRLRDISIIFISLFGVIATILLAAIVGAILWLVLTIKDQVVPLLQTLTDTVRRVRGTTEFVTEQAASPIIQAAGTFAKIRAATKTATGGKPRPVPRQRRTD